MNRILKAVFLLVVSSGSLFFEDAIADAHAAINCDLATVDAAIKSAAAGSTIVCKSGAWIWSAL